MSISITTEVVCDECHQVIATSGPRQEMTLHEIIEWTLDAAKRRGANVGLCTVECADCHAKSTTTTPDNFGSIDHL